MSKSLPCFSEDVLSRHQDQVSQLRSTLVEGQALMMRSQRDLARLVSKLTTAQKRVKVENREQLRSGAKSLNDWSAPDFALMVVNRRTTTTVSDLVVAAQKAGMVFANQGSLFTVFNSVLAKLKQDKKIKRVSRGVYASR